MSKLANSSSKDAAETLLEINKLNVSVTTSSNSSRALPTENKPILNSIELSLNRGDVLGIIGESGSGKSMLALSIMGLLPEGFNTAGEINFDQQNLLKLSEEQLCKLRGSDISMVFQEPMTALNPVLSIGKQVAECIKLHRNVSNVDASKIAEETLAKVGLPVSQYPLSRYPHELSGGQRQRVVIAMAIALRPALLIADEPTTALDVTTQAGILDLLKQLVVDEQLALILISHDLAVVNGIADHIVIMRNGDIVERGSLKQLFKHSKHPYTCQLIEASKHVPDRVDAAVDAAPLLDVENLSCEYRMPRKHWWSKPRYFRALKSVSLSIKQGESVGLVGESGCGKSTLTRALLGLMPIAEGEIRLHGELLAKGETLSNAVRREMQVVFQDPYGSFNPRHKVKRLVAEPLHVLEHALSEQEQITAVNDALVSVGLQASDASKYIHEFSGGQRQRIAIARALIIKPALIVLDEAVSALDVSVRAQILDLLSALAASHRIAYLFISHDLSVVRRVTDRVLVMQQGEIVERGQTEAVFNNPSHPYTQQLLAATPQLPDEENQT